MDALGIGRRVVPDCSRLKNPHGDFPRIYEKVPSKVANKSLTNTYANELYFKLASTKNLGIDRSNIKQRLYTLSSLPDLTDTANYTKVVNAVAERVKGTGLNVLFNNAGISSKFTRLGLVKQEQITDALLINTVAPILLTKVRVRACVIALISSS